MGDIRLSVLRAVRTPAKTVDSKASYCMIEILSSRPRMMPNWPRDSKYSVV